LLTDPKGIHAKLIYIRINGCTGCRMKTKVKESEWSATLRHFKYPVKLKSLYVYQKFKNMLSHNKRNSSVYCLYIK